MPAPVAVVQDTARPNGPAGEARFAPAAGTASRIIGHETSAGVPDWTQLPGMRGLVVEPPMPVPFPVLTWLLAVLAGLVFAAIAWMHFAYIDETASAPGVVRWAGKARPVSHAEGGRVVRSLVRNGERVSAGQALIVLDDDQLVPAPTDGIVKGLRALNPGTIVPPGETVAEIVPSAEERRFEIEARVANADIGMVAVGQDAFIRIQAYDWTRHGALRGTVVHIAGEAVGPDFTPRPRGGGDGQSWFLVRILPDKDFLGDDPRHKRLRAGMTASIHLHFGERSILDYFTAGFRRTLGSSVHEPGG